MKIGKMERAEGMFLLGLLFFILMITTVENTLVAILLVICFIITLWGSSEILGIKIDELRKSQDPVIKLCYKQINENIKIQEKHCKELSDLEEGRGKK